MRHPFVFLSCSLLLHAAVLGQAGAVLSISRFGDPSGVSGPMTQSIEAMTSSVGSFPQLMSRRDVILNLRGAAFGGDTPLVLAAGAPGAVQTCAGSRMARAGSGWSGTAV